MGRIWASQTSWQLLVSGVHEHGGSQVTRMLRV